MPRGWVQHVRIKQYQAACTSGSSSPSFILTPFVLDGTMRRSPKSYVHSFLTWDKSPKTSFSRGNLGLPSLVRSHESLLSLGPRCTFSLCHTRRASLSTSDLGRLGIWCARHVLLVPFRTSFVMVPWHCPLTTVFQLGIRQRRGKKWSTAVSNIKRSQMGLGFCFPGSSSRLIHLSIVWTIEVAKTRSFFDSLKRISLSHWLVMAMYHVCHCWSQEAWVIYMQRWGTWQWHMSRSGPDTYLPSLCSWLRSSRCCFHSMRAMWCGTLPEGRWLKVEGWGWRNKNWWRNGFAKLQNIFFSLICGKNTIRVVGKFEST